MLSDAAQHVSAFADIYDFIVLANAVDARMFIFSREAFALQRSVNIFFISWHSITPPFFIFSIIIISKILYKIKSADGVRRVCNALSIKSKRPKQVNPSQSFYKNEWSEYLLTIIRIEMNNMLIYEDLPDYSHDMHMRGFSPSQILEAFRRTNRKNMEERKKKKREESFLEKEFARLVESLAKASIDAAVVNLFQTLEM